MNCDHIRSTLSYECVPSRRGLCAYTPFTYHDGEVIRFFVEPVDQNRVRLTDECDAVMHMTGRGVHLSAARLKDLRRLIEPVHLSDGGRIDWTGSIDELSDAAPAFVSALIAAAHAESGWLPKPEAISFRHRVGMILAERVPIERLGYNEIVQGASRRALEFPFSVHGAPEAYIETVHFSANAVDWSPISRSYTKMADLKHAGADATRRYIVIEDNVIDNEENLENAVSLLVTAAVVLPFTEHESWIEELLR